MKRVAVALVAAVIVTAATSRYARPWIDRAVLLYALATEAPPAHLLIPVKDVAGHRLANSWGNPRSGGRRHQGIDIFAPAGTPVLSATRGIVTRVGTNTLGGQVVWVLGPGLEWHYYAHLDRYGAFRPGDIVHEGDVIGYVGTTGNARGGPPHLHYGIYRRGGAENPFPRLSTTTAAGVYGTPSTMNASMSVRVSVAADALVASTVTRIVWVPAGRALTAMTRRGSVPAL